MFTGYLQLGGNEIANTDRLVGYSTSAECPAHWIRQIPCGTLADALGDGTYVASSISAAPWFDPTRPEVSARFFGISVIDMHGRHDSTRKMNVTQAVGNGGVIGDIRHNTKEFRVEAILLAAGDVALSYGLDWLNSQLEPGACGQHGGACGLADLSYLEACPPPMVYMPDPENPGEEIPDREAYDELLRPLQRFLHDVGVTSGATVKEYLATSSDPNGPKGAIVEFTVTSERGYVYSRAQSVPLLTTADAYEDVQRNLFRNPTADFAGPTNTLRYNLVPNPSLETAVTGWSIAGRTVPPVGFPSAVVTVTGGRTSGELRAVGTWSMKAVTTEHATFDTEAVITLLQTMPANLRQVKLGIWGAVSDPNSTVTRLRAEYQIAGGEWMPLDEATDVAFAKGGYSYKAVGQIELPEDFTAAIGLRFIASGKKAFSAYADAAMVIEG